MLIILMISYLLWYGYFPMQVLTDTSMSFLEREHLASLIAKDVIISLTVIHAFGFWSISRKFMSPTYMSYRETKGRTSVPKLYPHFRPMQLRHCATHSHHLLTSIFYPFACSKQDSHLFGHYRTCCCHYRVGATLLFPFQPCMSFACSDVVHDVFAQ